MAKAKIINRNNFFQEAGEFNDEASKTVPNQSMTVQEMVQRYNSGLPLSGGKVPMFNGEDPLPDITNMDLADAQAITEAIADQLADAKARIDQAKTTYEAKQELEKIEAKALELLEKMKKEQQTKPDEKP